MIWNEIKGFLQRAKDALTRLMPWGHGQHSSDTFFPNSAPRHVKQSNPGGYNTYAGSRGNDGRFMGRGRQAPGEQDVNPQGCFGALAYLQNAGVVPAQWAHDITDNILEMEY